MTPNEATVLTRFLLPQIENEIKTTSRVLAAVPDEKASYKPAEPNMSALELAQHIALTDYWFLDGILKGAFVEPDAGAEMPNLPTPSSVVKFYDEQVPALLAKLKELSPEHMSRQVQFYMFNLPLAGYLMFLMNHMIHHRGQLSVYLRPRGAKVPSIYGGSADEPFDTAAETAKA